MFTFVRVNGTIREQSIIIAVQVRFGFDSEIRQSTGRVRIVIDHFETAGRFELKPHGFLRCTSIVVVRYDFGVRLLEVDSVVVDDVVVVVVVVCGG